MKFKIKMIVQAIGCEETMEWVEEFWDKKVFVSDIMERLQGKFFRISIDNGGHLMVRTKDIVRLFINPDSYEGNNTDGCVEIPAETTGTAE